MARRDGVRAGYLWCVNVWGNDPISRSHAGWSDFEMRNISVEICIFLRRRNRRTRIHIECFC